MGGLSELLNRKSFRRSQQVRPCRSCGGKGSRTSAARAPDGTIPRTRVMIRVSCDDCAGRGHHIVGDEVHEKGRVRAWERDALILDCPDTPPRDD